MHVKRPTNAETYHRRGTYIMDVKRPTNAEVEMSGHSKTRCKAVLRKLGARRTEYSGLRSLRSRDFRLSLSFFSSFLALWSRRLIRGASILTSCVPLRCSSVLTKAVSCGSTIFPSLKRRCRERVGREARGIASRASLRKSLTP